MNFVTILLTVKKTTLLICFKFVAWNALIFPRTAPKPASKWH